MSINTGRKYSILAYAGDGLSPNGIIPCLNVHGASNTVANGSKVTVYNDLQEISELWTLLPEANGNYRIKSLATPNPAGDYVLNYSTAASSLGSCTMWNKLEDSSGVDTIVKIEAVSGKTEIYTIKLVTAKMVQLNT